MSNPEFKRNIWMELTLHRLIAMPVILGTLFSLFYLMNKEDSNETFIVFVIIVYVFLIFIWGVRNASESILSEVKERTWDFQRMSAMSPWSMTWGKLFGSTLFVWYGALISILVYIFFSKNIYPDDTYKTALYFIAAGLTGHSVAFLAALQLLKRDKKTGRLSSTGTLMTGIFTSVLLLIFIDDTRRTILWYSDEYQHINLFLPALILFYFWSLAANYRLMKAELQRKSVIPLYPFFLVFLIAFVTGFFEYNITIFIRAAILSVAIPVSLNYLLLLLDNKSPVIIRKIISEYNSGNIKNILDLLPAWIVSFLIILPAVIVLLFISPASFDIKNSSHLKWISFVVAILFFHIRDIAVILFFNFSKNPSRADAAALLYLGILYIAAPGILYFLDLKELTSPFWPMPFDNGLSGIIFAPVEAALMIYFLFRRWKKFEVINGKKYIFKSRTKESIMDDY